MKHSFCNTFTTGSPYSLATSNRQMCNNHALSNPVEIVFYYKDDCRLCDDMTAQLNQFISGLDEKTAVFVQMRDVEDDPKWYARFREYVPVLVVGGEEVCHYFFDGAELRSAISPAGN